MESELLKKIVEILDTKKAINIKQIDIKDKTTKADYFIVASGTSNTHVKSLANNVEEEIKKENIVPNKIEGYESATWILMDYGEVIIHLFTEKERENYSIEDLWGKVKEE